MKTTQSQTVIFFGAGDYVIPIIKVLSSHGLFLVVTTEKKGAFTEYLHKNQIDFIVSDLKDQAAKKYFAAKDFSLGVSASYGAIIPSLLINKFELGILNIHPSLLPKYRGASPVQETILREDKISGTTIIKMDNLVDHGPIILQEKINLSGKETKASLTKDLFLLGTPMLEKIISDIEEKRQLKEYPQNHVLTSFTKKINKEDGYIDINNPPAPCKLGKMIRAYYPWPGVWTKFKTSDSKLTIIKLLPEKKIQIEGGRPMTYKDFINGYQKIGLKLLEKLSLTV